MSATAMPICALASASVSVRSASSRMIAAASSALIWSVSGRWFMLYDNAATTGWPHLTECRQNGFVSIGTSALRCLAPRARARRLRLVRGDPIDAALDPFFQRRGGAVALRRDAHEAGHHPLAHFHGL